MANGYHDSISDRQRLLLALVVEHYIASAEAVGSRTLTEIMENAVSSATVRNELSELDRMGYLEQPHVSAGRVPTLNGYRFYIDNLMHSKTLTPIERALCDSKLSGIKAGSMEDFIKKAADALGEITGCAVIASAPEIGSTLRRIEYFPMSASSGVAAVLTSSGLIKSRMAATEGPVSSAMLYRFLQIANAQLTGKRPDEIGHWDYSIIAQATGNYVKLFTPVLEAIAELIKETQITEVYFTNQRHLVDAVGAAASAEVIKLLSDEEALRKLLSQVKEASVVMGSETGKEELINVSLILSPYECFAEQAGAFGLVTDTRTDYSKLLPLIDYFTRRVGAVLN